MRVGDSHSQKRARVPRWTGIFPLLAALAFAPSAALAWESSAQISPIEPDWLSASNSVQLDTMSYLSPDSLGKNTVYPSLTGNLRTRQVSNSWEASIWGEAKIMVPPASPTYYFEFPELNFGTSQAWGPVQVKIGRKLEQWNHLDEQWRLGIWQPRFRWDYLQPESVGLTGIFLTVNQPSFQLVAFASDIFVPERGVPVNVQNGSIVSDSPWFVSPPDHVKFSNDVAASTPVQYNLQIPPMSDILFHPSVSLMGRLGADKGFWLSTAYAYKPMNQLLLAFDAYLQQSVASPYVPVTVFPRVAYHHLVSLEGGYNADHWKVWASGLWDNPVRDETDPTWTTQEVSPSFAVSPTIDYTFGHPGKNPLRLDLSFLYQNGGNAPDAGQDAAPGSTKFEPRYPFQRALSIGGQSGLPESFGSWASRFTVSSHFIQDITHLGQILSTEFRYTTIDRGAGHWTLALGADLLGSDSNDEASGYDYIARYQGFDRVHAGVTYVF